MSGGQVSRSACSPNWKWRPESDVGVDLDVKVLQGGHPGLQSQRFGRGDLRRLLQHTRGAAQHDGPCFVRQDAVRFEEHLGVDGQLGQFVAGGGADEQGPAAHHVVHRKDVRLACHGDYEPAVFGALNQFPGLFIVQVEDGIAVSMFEHHGFIVLCTVEKRQRWTGKRVGAAGAGQRQGRKARSCFPPVDNRDAQNVTSVTLKHCLDPGVLISIGGVADHDISTFRFLQSAGCRRCSCCRVAVVDHRLQQRRVFTRRPAGY